jgi:hypothetical protein
MAVQSTSRIIRQLHEQDAAEALSSAMPQPNDSARADDFSRQAAAAIDGSDDEGMADVSAAPRPAPGLATSAVKTEDESVAAAPELWHKAVTWARSLAGGSVQRDVAEVLEDLMGLYPLWKYHLQSRWFYRAVCVSCGSSRDVKGSALNECGVSVAVPAIDRLSSQDLLSSQISPQCCEFQCVQLRCTSDREKVGWQEIAGHPSFLLLIVKRAQHHAFFRVGSTPSAGPSILSRAVFRSSVRMEMNGAGRWPELSASFRNAATCAASFLAFLRLVRASSTSLPR